MTPTAAESRLAGNGQEAKMKLDALRANNETAKLEMQTMEKQLDVARSTQHQAKVRVVALQAEQKATQEAIRAIEVKTKEAWRKGAGKSAASAQSTQFGGRADNVMRLQPDEASPNSKGAQKVEIQVIGGDVAAPAASIRPATSSTRCGNV